MYVVRHTAMYCRIFIVVLTVAIVSANWDLDLLDLETMLFGKRTDKLEFSESFYPSLEGYHVNAKAIAIAQHPWIASVVHSRTYNEPHVCTASCIDEGIFVTAVRCVYSLKINYTGIKYGHTSLDAIAFVLPSNPSIQASDDVALIVVDTRNFNSPWSVIKTFTKMNRTDVNYNWFTSLEDSKQSEYVVVGFAPDKGPHRILAGKVPFDLHELKVVLDIQFCSKMYTLGRYKAYNVPCYYGCTSKEYDTKSSKCANYLGVEGAAVIDKRSKTLIGVATWGGSHSSYELPVGIAVPNTDTFYKDLECARKIRNARKYIVSKNYYQQLCDKV